MTMNSSMILANQNNQLWQLAQHQEIQRPRQIGRGMGVRIYQSAFKHKAGGNNKIGKNLQWTMGQGLETWRRGDGPSRRRVIYCRSRD